MNSELCMMTKWGSVVGPLSDREKEGVMKRPDVLGRLVGMSSRKARVFCRIIPSSTLFAMWTRFPSSNGRMILRYRGFN
jgi:hypothetical protein